MKVALLVNDKEYLDLRALVETNSRGLFTEQLRDLNDAYYRFFSSSSHGYGALVVQNGFEAHHLANFLSCIREHFPGLPVLQLETPETASSQIEPGCVDLAERDINVLVNRLIELDKKTMTCSERKERDKDVEILYKKYEAFLNSAGEAIVGIDRNGNITFVNAFACKLFEKKEAELLGSHLSDYAFNSPLEMGTSSESFKAEENGRRVGRGVIHNKNNKLIYVEYTQTYVGNSQDDTASIMVIEDISARVKFEAKLKSLANMDAVTGLYNRHYFKRVFEKERKSCREKNQLMALFFIDLDGFKKVNDQYGHLTGDKLLVSVAQRLQESSRRGDLIARLGGDEFVILVSDAKKPDIESIARHFIVRLSEPFIIDNETIQISASIGVSFVDQSSTKLEWHLKQADSAMYDVKQRGKSGYQIVNSVSENKQENA